MSDDYLWDGTGSPDAVEEHFERVAMLFEPAPLRAGHTMPFVAPRPASSWRGAVLSVLVGAAVALGVVYGLRPGPEPAPVADDASVAGHRRSTASSTREVFVRVPPPREPNDDLRGAVPEPVAPAAHPPESKTRRPRVHDRAGRATKTPNELRSVRAAETLNRAPSRTPKEIPNETETEGPQVGPVGPNAGSAAPTSRAQAGDLLRDQVETYANQIASCFDQVSPVASGAMVVMGFDLTAEGIVRDPKRVRDTLGDASAARRVGACLGRMLRRWRFPAAPGLRRIEAPFIHTAQGVDP